MSTDAEPLDPDALTPLRQLPQEYIAEFPLAQLEEYPGNPKDHDLGLLDESLNANGWYGVIIAQRRKWKAGGKAKARVLAGHGRFKGLRARGVSHAPVVLLDCDEATARRIVLVDNEASKRGGYNDAALFDFLRPMSADLTGTGFDTGDLDTLAALLSPSDGHTSTDGAKEIDVEALRGAHACPRCGFEFDTSAKTKVAATGS